jgi:hypothetical protein
MFRLAGQLLAIGFIVAVAIEAYKWWKRRN